MKGEFYRMEYEAWDEGTDALTLEQEAAYLRLCHQMYRRRGAVPGTPATLARIWRCHPNKARKLLDDLLAAGKVVESPEGLTNNRVVVELAHRESISTVRSQAGREGATARGRSRSGAVPAEGDAGAVRVLGGSSAGVGGVSGNTPPVHGETPPTRTGVEGETTPGPVEDNGAKSLNLHGPPKALAEGGPKQNQADKRRGEERREESQHSKVQGDPLGFEALGAALRCASGLESSPSPGLEVLGPIYDLLTEGYDLERHILPVCRALKAKGKRWHSWHYIVDAVRDRNGAPKAAPAATRAATPSPETENVRFGYKAMLKRSWRDKRWPDGWPPEPGKPDSPFTDEIVAEARREFDAERRGVNGAAAHP